MNISRFPVSPFVEMTYILWTADGGEAAVVDPGMMNEAEREMVAGFIDEHHLQMKHILLTHMHIDHVSSAQWMAQRYALPLEGGKADEFMGSVLPEQAHHFRLPIELEPLALDKYLADGDVFTMGDEEIHVIGTPGHSMGSLSFYLPQSHFVMTGDALCAGSIGRTDLPGGDYETLIGTIKRKLFTLPPDTVVYPGHGSETTIGDEVRFNPYF